MVRDGKARPTSWFRWGVPALAALVLVAGVAAFAVTSEDEGSGGAAGGERAAEKPNFVVIMTDDQWLESMRAMPRARKLIGEQGVTFANYYAAEPICCPSRATYLTGQFAHNNGVRHNAPPQGGYRKLKDGNTLPVWLSQAGYATSHIGKYPNGYGRRAPRRVPPGWTEWRGSIDPTTYQMYGYTLNENGTLHTYGKPTVEDPRYYQTDVYRDKAADFVQRQSKGGRPFFLSVAFLAPHGEKTPAGAKNPPAGGKAPNRAGVGPAPRPAPRHKGRYANEPLPAAKSYDEADVADKPAYMKAYPRIDKQTSDRIQESYRGRMESLLAVDEAVEKVVRTLESAGELDNTYLLFTTDNGFFFGQHRIPTGKLLPHEPSSHLPLLVRGPGLPAGRTSKELTSTPDLAATITDATGARPGLALDGRSLLPYARDTGKTSGRPLLQEIGDGALPGVAGAGPRTGDSSGRAAAGGDLDQDIVVPKKRRPPPPGHGQVVTASYEAIRTGRYLYVRYVGGEEELYDYQVDPDELTSLHKDPRYAQVRKDLAGKLDRLQSCKGAACTQPVPAPPQPS